MNLELSRPARTIGELVFGIIFYSALVALSGDPVLRRPVLLPHAARGRWVYLPLGKGRLRPALNRCPSASAPRARALGLPLALGSAGIDSTHTACKVI